MENKVNNEEKEQKQKKTIFQILGMLVYFKVALVIKVIGWVIKWVTLGLFRHFLTWWRDVFFMRHAKVLKDKDGNTVLDENGKPIKEVWHEPQPLYVWVIFFVVITGSISIMLCWNLGLSMGVA